VNRLSLWLLTFALAASCSHALAQDTPDQRALQLERVLGSFASQAHDGRVATGAMQAAAGVLTLTPGIVLVTRDDANLRALGTGFIVAGAINLLAVPAMLFPTKVEALYAELHRPAADGGARAALVAKVEADLQEAVRQQRFRRPIQAAAFFALGIPASAVGLTFLLAKPGLASMKAGTQRDWGALLTAIGVPYLSLGFLQLFQTSPEEAAWELYQAELTRPQRATPRASLSLAPLIGGASANLALAF
jgi:hypothetical protein